MCRSVKRIPACDIAGKDSSWKKIFNRRIRRCAKFQDLPNGNAYRKCNPSWYISDYKDHHRSFDSFACGLTGDKNRIYELYQRYYFRK